MHAVNFRLAAAAAALAVGAGCAPHAKIDKLYQDPAARGADYERLLVIGIAGSPEQRRRIEDLIADELESDGLSAVPGYTRLGSSPVLAQDAVDEAAATTKSEAVLISHIVSVSSEPELREGRVDIKSECRGGNPIDFFLYDHEELREPDSVEFAHEVVIVTNLYDSVSGKRLWTIQSTCFEKAEFEAVLQREARAIVDQLRRDRLVASGSD